MADKVTSTSTLSVEYGFADADTRTVQFKNPKNNLTGAEIKAAAQKAIDDKLIIGDKASAEVTEILQAYKTDTTKTVLDIPDPRENN